MAVIERGILGGGHNAVGTQLRDAFIRPYWTRRSGGTLGSGRPFVDGLSICW